MSGHRHISKAALRQKPVQYCKAISFLIKINGKKKENYPKAALNFTGSLFSTVGVSKQMLIGQKWFGEQISLEETLIKPASVGQSVLVAQTCLALCDPMDCSPPSSSVRGILQARILEWVAIPSSRGSSWPGDQTQVSCLAGIFFTLWATKEAQSLHTMSCSWPCTVCVNMKGYDRYYLILFN